MDREGVLRPGLRDVGVGDRATVDHIDSAASDDIELTAAENDGGILVDADAELTRVLGDRARQAADPAALGKMLVDDDVPHQAEPCGEVQVPDPVCLWLLPFTSIVSLITEAPAEVPAITPPASWISRTRRSIGVSPRAVSSRESEWPPADLAGTKHHRRWKRDEAPALLGT